MMTLILVREGADIEDWACHGEVPENKTVYLPGAKQAC